jgi:pyruvate dehydrogenase E1 component alpha subunit
LTSDDFLFATHRGHGYYLARFNDPVGLLAEVMGKQMAVCNGVGGSQHIFREHRYLSTGIQGESLPVAAGVAFSLKKANKNAAAIVTIGDGTWGEGEVYEALNIAQLWRLPLVVIVENNGIAQSTPKRLQMAGNIADRAKAFGVRYQRIDTKDINAIRKTLARELLLVRQKRIPIIVEFITERLGPHSKSDDTRPVEEKELIRSRDLCANYQRQFFEQWRVVEAQVRERMSSVLHIVEKLPLTYWNVQDGTRTSN